jgi:trimeric autotransporter adhesin
VVLTAAASPAYTIGSPSSGTVTITSDDLPPDFAVTAVSGPAYATPATAITISVTVKNQGGGEAAASQLGFYLSANASLDAGDAFLTDAAVPALGIGASHTFSTSIEVPAATVADSYMVIVAADDPNAIAESNETNNTRGSSWIKVGADLLVSALTAPKTAAAGETIQVTDTTKNQGETPSATSTTSFYLSTNTSFDTADLVLGSRAIGVLGFNGTDAGLTALMIPSTLAPGSYYVLAKADSGNVVPEYLETNNVKASAQLKVGADLSVSALSAPAEAAAGTTIDVTETTSNLGAADSPASKTRYYFSTNTSIDAADTLLGERAVPALDAATANTITSQVTVPASTVGGQYYLIANADADHEITETSESNNVKTFRISVGPDLVVTSVAVPDAIAPGSAFNVTDTTVNDAAGSASGTQTAFYLSTNAAFDASDVLIGSRAVPALAGAQSSNVTTPLVMPAATAIGLYYVIAKADSTAAIFEVLENNNVKASTQVRVGPDLLVTILNAPSTVVRGVAFNVSDTTSNVGVAVGATTTSYYLSTNNTLDAGDLLLGSRTVGPLATNITQSGNATVTIPAGQVAGTYYLFAKADGGNVAAETSETNNAKSRTIKINP